MTDQARIVKELTWFDIAECENEEYRDEQKN